MLKNLEEYIEKDDRLELLLKQLSASGRKTFLLTNSEYYYTEVRVLLICIAIH